MAAFSYVAICQDIFKERSFQPSRRAFFFMRMPFLIRALGAPSTDPVPREGFAIFIPPPQWQKAARDVVLSRNSSIHALLDT